MANKKKLKFSLVMEYFPDEDRLEFLEEKIDEIDNIIIRVEIEKLSTEDFVEYLKENKGEVAIA